MNRMETKGFAASLEKCGDVFIPTKGLDQRVRAGMLSVSAGTEAVDGRVLGGYRYEKGAFVPKGPWRVPKVREIEAIAGREGMGINPGCSVTVIRFCDEVLRPLEENELLRIESVDHLESLKESRRYKYALTRFRDSLAEHITSFSGLHLAGAFINKPGLRTSTFDHESKTLVGLHVDNFYPKVSTDADTVPVRLCVNIGREPRAFLFMNLTLKRVACMVGAASVRPRWPSGIARRFLAKFPDYPVIKLVILPREGYLAPTENVIHDGCTEDMQTIDVSLVMRGRFLFPAGGYAGA